MTEFPAWAVALFALISAICILTERALPFFVRMTVITPRLAVFVLYIAYSLYDMDIENRMTIARWMFSILFLVEIITAIFMRFNHGKIPSARTT